MCLKPVSPVGVIHTHKYDCLLYDNTSDESVRTKRNATPVQLAALAALEKDKKKRAQLIRGPRVKPLPTALFARQRQLRRQRQELMQSLGKQRAQVIVKYVDENKLT